MRGNYRRLAASRYAARKPAHWLDRLARLVVTIFVFGFMLLVAITVWFAVFTGVWFWGWEIWQ